MSVITLHVFTFLLCALPLLLCFSERPRYAAAIPASARLPSPASLPTLLCAWVDKVLVPDSLFVSVNFLHPGREPLALGTDHGQAQWSLGTGTTHWEPGRNELLLLLCRSMNPAQEEKLCSFPRTLARKQDPDPNHPIPVRSWPLAVQDMEW